ncbi:MAG: hypothetical protein A3B30_02150 [Candidatus Komeilibacteria bacterium RIFCSPLOWO2_01_FULL_52_15]|uniref:Uncharacterized protein n=1 Tax=Candidatus Komeilibacteria bacterium RIFCSPLOWO2_01_FULL_52_15 TaxID=1798551 RepID=A0A1G2BT10_9BACT|nr:MAG: hypothetical protein A3B30_02150 [Candidatus Komeilibacteria bacterium RIFCSPLOWO2_01_FULL_52_15]
MEINKSAFAGAAAVTTGAAYLACAVVVSIAPKTALIMLGWLTHILNVDKFAGDVRMTAAGVAIGLVEAVVYAYIVGWIFAWMYTVLSKGKQQRL